MHLFTTCFTPLCAPICERSGHISTPPISQKTTHCYSSITPYFTLSRLGCKRYFTLCRLGLGTNICEQKFTIRTQDDRLHGHRTTEIRKRLQRYNKKLIYAN